MRSKDVVICSNHNYWSSVPYVVSLWCNQPKTKYHSMYLFNLKGIGQFKCTGTKWISSTRICIKYFHTNYKVANRTLKGYSSPVNTKPYRITRLPIAQLKHIPRQSMSRLLKNHEAWAAGYSNPNLVRQWRGRIYPVQTRLCFAPKPRHVVFTYPWSKWPNNERRLACV